MLLSILRGLRYRLSFPSPGLAASRVAWLAGTPPVVTAAERRHRASPVAYRNGGRRGTWRSFAVTGALTGRLGPARLVSAPRRSGISPLPIVAVSGSDTTYGAWPQGKRFVWMVAAAHGGSFPRLRARSGSPPARSCSSRHRR